MNDQEKNTLIGQLVVKIAQIFTEEERRKFQVFIPINEKYIYAEEYKPLKKHYLYFLIDISTKEYHQGEKFNLEDFHDRTKFNEKNKSQLLEQGLLWDIPIEGNIMKLGNLICKLNMTALKSDNYYKPLSEKMSPISADHWLESC